MMDVTAEFVLRLQKEWEHHLLARNEHEKKAAAVKAMLDAISVLNPEIMKEAKTRHTAEEEASMTATVEDMINRDITLMSIPDAVRKVLGEAPRAMTKVALRQRLIAAGMPEEKLGQNAAYFYTVVRRLEKSGEIRRRGKLISIAA